MALQGTIETFPVIDVLHLLAAAGHTGRLTVEGARGHAELWVADGVLHAGRVDGREQIEGSSLVMQVLRHETGVFLFENVALPDTLGAVMAPVALDAAVEGGLARLAEWRAVEAVVPSVAHRLRLSSALPVEEVVLDRQRWAFVVAASRWPALAEAAAELGMDDLSAGRMAVEMVAAGMLVVEEPIDGAVGRPGGGPEDGTTLEVDSHVVVETVVDPAPPAGASDGPSWDPAASGPMSGASLDMGSTSPTVPVDLTVPSPHAAPSDPVVVPVDPEPAGTDAGFPERFPIDDLLGGDPSDDWGVLGEPLPPVVTDPFAGAREQAREHPDATPDEALPDDVPFPAVGPVADEVELSPTGAAPTADPVGAVPPPVEPVAGPPAGVTFAGLPDLDPVDVPGAPVGGVAFDASPVDEAELRRQMAHLSPKAAEAVAAALEQLADPSAH